MEKLPDRISEIEAEVKKLALELNNEEYQKLDTGGLALKACIELKRAIASMWERAMGVSKVENGKE